MKFKFKDGDGVFEILKNTSNKFFGHELDAHGCFECTKEEAIFFLNMGGGDRIDFVEGTPFNYIFRGNLIAMTPITEEHIQDLLDEVKVISDEIFTYHLDEVREVSKMLGYIPARQQGVKQIANKFEGREQEFLDLLKELYPKK